MLTHDPKFDVPLLEVALRSPAAYIGAMGSRRTHDDRLAQAARGRRRPSDELARLHSPIGLDLGARTPEETAVSIAAEIVRARWGGSGRPLAETDGRHPRRRRPPARPEGRSADVARRDAASPGWCSPPASGSRFGRPKALVEFDGELLVDAGGRGCCRRRLRAGRGRARRGGRRGARRCATGAARRRAAGLGRPAWAPRCGPGLAALPTDADAVVVALVDQPLVGAEAVGRLRAAHAAGAVAAVATYAGRPRNPVLLDRVGLGRGRRAATGDAGARDAGCARTPSA